MSEYQLYSQDYMTEDEDICDVCKNVRNVSELETVEVDERGGIVNVCKECIRKGWAEE